MREQVYLVTGAAGFLGNNVVQQLLNQKKDVRVLVLENDPAVRYLPQEADIFVGDISKKETLKDFFYSEKELIVIHCASLVTTAPEEDPKVYAVNVTGTKNIVDLCIENEAKKLIYISSTGAITELPHGQIITEPLVFEPEKVVGYYEKTKALATQYVLKAVEQFNLDASIIYPSGIVGPNDGSFGPLASFIIRFCQGKMKFGVEGTFNAVDVRDLATAVIEAVTKGKKGEGYILSNELIDMKSMLDLISLKSNTLKIETILSVEDMLAMATNSLTTDNDNKEALRFELYNLTRNNHFSNAKAVEVLDFESRPFEETIEDTVNWLKKENKI